MADFADMVIVDDGEDSGGLFGAVKSATEEVAASQGVDEGVEENVDLKLKVKGGKLNTKGLTGKQKWRAALGKIDDEHVETKSEKKKLERDPVAQETLKLLKTLELALVCEATDVESASTSTNKKTEWNGMLENVMRCLWSRCFDADAMKEFLQQNDGVRIVLEVVVKYEYVVEVVMYGVGLLASLCLEHHARETFKDCDGCKLITDLLKKQRKHATDHPNLIYNFSNLVKIIAVNPDAQGLFVEAGMPDVLMQELEDTHPPLSELSIYETASALANIAATARNAHEIAIKTSGLGRIVALINLQKRLDHADASEDEIAALASLIKVMWNLTDDPEIHDECFEQRVPLLMKDLVERHYESNEITTNALGALKNLSSIEGISKEQMGDRQRQLVSTLPIMMERLERASIVNIKVKALAYVTNLSYDEAFKEIMLDEGILEAVVVTMRNHLKYLPLQRLGATLLCNLTAGSTALPSSERLVDIYALAHVRKVMDTSPKDKQFLRPAAALVRNMACMGPKFREHVAERQNMLRSIMLVLRDHPANPGCVRNCCMALSAFCTEAVYAWEICKRGGVRLTIKTIEEIVDKSDMKSKDRCTIIAHTFTLLHNLCCVEEGRIKLSQTLFNVYDGQAAGGQRLQQMHQAIQITKEGGREFKSEYEIATTLLKVAEEETKKRIVRETGGESALAPAERGNYCFVVGGHSDPHHLASVLKLDIRSMRWSACAKMKYKRYKPAAVFSPDGRYLYVFGGHNETDKLDSVEALDTETNEWIELEPMPSKRSHIAGDRQPNSPYIYAVGGNDGSGAQTGRLKSVIRFNMETNKWQSWGEMLGARSAPGIAFSLKGDYLYVAGGSDGSTKLKTAERLKIKTNEWLELPEMNSARSGCCAAMGPDGKFYVCGGYNGSQRLNSVEMYDPVTNEWQTGPDMLMRRSGAAAARGPDGSLYVVGGTDGSTQHATMEQLTFHGRSSHPTSWEVITEMETGRECPAACFSFSVIEEKEEDDGLDDSGMVKNPLAEDDDT